MECKYVFKKGNCKGQLCNKKNCKLHILSTSQNTPTPKLSKSKVVTVNVTIPQSKNNSELQTLANNIIDIDKSLKKRVINEDNIKQQILDLDTSINNKTTIMKQFLNIKKLDINSTEYYKNQLYIDQAILIPWSKCYNIRDQIGINNNYLTLDQHIHDKVLVRNFIQNISDELDKSIFGMENVKNEIINYVCKFITNPHSQKNNIALYGSAGVCKTKFIKVLSKALNLPMKIISLGGMKDSSYLLGHNQTYQDSKCGIIVQSVIESNVINPILYFDELDKVSNTECGQDIYSVLSNLTDPTINSNFKDRYFSNLSIDLSKVFYVFTFNDISKINKVLLDRLNVVYVSNPTKKEKTIILKNYCLQDIRENIGIPFEIEFDNECYSLVIDYTDKNIDSRVSSGIRESMRILEKIMLEINKEILLNKFDMSKLIIDTKNFTKYFNKLKAQFIFIQSDEPPFHMYT